jgi:hypothetical protein
MDRMEEVLARLRELDSLRRTNISQALACLRLAIVMSLPSDDQDLMARVREAYTLLGGSM